MRPSVDLTTVTDSHTSTPFLCNTFWSCADEIHSQSAPPSDSLCENCLPWAASKYAVQPAQVNHHAAPKGVVEVMRSES